MSHLAYIQRLYTYNDWANREMLDVLRAADRVPALSLKRMAHIVAAEHVWFQRLREEPVLVPVWPDWSVQEIDVQIDQMKEGWSAFLDTLLEHDLTDDIKYTNTKGKCFKSRRDDVLQHVIAHGAYHRGQIASDLRAAGINPPVSGLIFGTRNQSF